MLAYIIASVSVERRRTILKPELHNSKQPRLRREQRRSQEGVHLAFLPWHIHAVDYEARVHAAAPT